MRLGIWSRQSRQSLSLQEHYKTLAKLQGKQEHDGVYLKAFFDVSLSSLSFLSFWAGGVPVRLDALESSPALPNSGLRVFEPRAPENMELGPNVWGAMLACRDVFRL